MEIIDVAVHAVPQGEMCGREIDAYIDTVLDGLRNP
jgi:hypothetical protein